jgi:hypothetical protein
MDYEVSVPAAKFDELKAEAASAQRPKAMMLIPRKCAKQFHDKTSLATCVITETKGERRAKVVTYNYDRASLEKDDRLMRLCLQKGGDWQSKPQ